MTGLHSTSRKGEIYGSWIVIGRDYDYKGHNTKYICQCICGTRKSVFFSNLKRGKSKNCRKDGCHFADGRL